MHASNFLVLKLSVLAGFCLMTVASGCLAPPVESRRKLATSYVPSTALPGVGEFEETAGGLRPDLTGPGVIALGMELSVELRLNLQTQGLSLTQASAIAEKAFKEVRASIIAIDVSSGFELTDETRAKSLLHIAGPLLVKGATKALDDDDVGLPKEQRADTLSGVVRSSFQSLKGRTEGLASADLIDLSKSLVSVAAQSLSEAGISEADAGVASRSITRGAVSALAASGITSTLISDVVAAVVTGTVSGFASPNISADTVRAIAANATTGAISSLGTTGLSAEASIAVMGEVASSSINALKAFSPGMELAAAVASDVTASAIQALQGSEVLSSGHLADAVKTIAQGSVEGLKDSGLGTAALTEGASAVAAGAIKGLAKTATSEQLSAGGLADAAISGTFAGMATASELSDTAKSDLMATVVEKTVSNLAETSSAEVRKALLGEVVTAAVSGMQTLGINSVATAQISLQSMSAKATQSLVAAGFSTSELSAATQVLTDAAVKSLDQVGLASVSASELKAMVTVVVSGVSAGLDQLSSQGSINASIKDAVITTSASAAAQAISTLQISQSLSNTELNTLVQETQTNLASYAKPSIRYPNSVYTFNTLQTVSIIPQVEGAMPTLCKVIPNLPVGLILQNNCTISGTPTVAASVLSYQIIPASDKGEGNIQTLSITVKGTSSAISTSTDSSSSINASTSTDSSSSINASTSTDWDASSDVSTSTDWESSSESSTSTDWESSSESSTSTDWESSSDSSTSIFWGLSTNTSTSTATGVPEISYSQQIYDAFDASGAATSVAISPQNLGGPIVACASDQALPPGFVFWSDCQITGQVDFSALDQMNYKPANAERLDLNGQSAPSSDQTSYDSCDPTATVEDEAQYKYVIPFEITPYNMFGAGESARLKLAIRRPFSIYPKYDYRFQLTETGSCVRVAPRSDDAPSSGESCTIQDVTDATNSIFDLPEGLSFDSDSCILSSTGNNLQIFDKKFKVTKTRSNGSTVESFFKLRVESSSSQTPEGSDSGAGNGFDCSQLTAGGSWVHVPGDPNYDTGDFCVQKYVPTNVNSIPISQAGTMPWASISQNNAKNVCTALGQGFHLITNPEWMTLAVNIATVGENWSGSAVGSGELARGHSDSSPNSACAADESDANAWVQTNCTSQTQGLLQFRERRTHTLSNGEVIWDIGGNVAQWVDAYKVNNKPISSNSWIEYSALGNGTTDWPRSAFVPLNNVQSWWTDSWNSTQSIGQIYPGTNGSGGALVRGAHWSSTSSAGVFAAYLQNSPDFAAALLSFRCAWQPPSQ